MSEDGQTLDETKTSPVDAACDESHNEAEGPEGPNAKSFVLEDLNGDVPVTNALANQQTCDSVGQLRIEFAATMIPADDVEHWQSGRLIKFDEPNSATVRVFIGKTFIANGELVDVAGQIGVRVLERMDLVGREAA